MNYQLIYNNIINNSKFRILTDYKENHHIIPKCLGGANKKENIVSLTPKEHYICHKLLVKIYQGQDKYKMIYALNRLINRYNKHFIHKINSRSYAKSKKDHALLMSNRIVSLQTRQKLSQYRKGKTHTEETKEKLSNMFKGRILSKQWKSKISEAHIGKPKSKDAVKKISNYWKETLKIKPWKNSRTNLEVWSKANIIYELKCQGKSLRQISLEWNIPYTSFVKISKKLNSGWIPLQDIHWCQDFLTTPPIF